MFRRYRGYRPIRRIKQNYASMVNAGSWNALGIGPGKWRCEGVRIFMPLKQNDVNGGISTTGLTTSSCTVKHIHVQALYPEITDGEIYDFYVVWSPNEVEPTYGTDQDIVTSLRTCYPISNAANILGYKSSVPKEGGGSISFTCPLSKKLNPGESIWLVALHRNHSLVTTSVGGRITYNVNLKYRTN